MAVDASSYGGEEDAQARHPHASGRSYTQTGRYQNAGACSKRDEGGNTLECTRVARKGLPAVISISARSRRMNPCYRRAAYAICCRSVRRLLQAIGFDRGDPI